MLMNRESSAPVCAEDILHLISEARPEQQRAIRSTKPFIVVGAGAGTGKTHTLARRFAWLLASDPECKVDQIVTLTYTKMAAFEMKERIRSILTDWYSRNPELLSHLKDAIDRMDESYISTIHSFAMRVIRESGLELDVEPNVSIVGEPFDYEHWGELGWNLNALMTSRITAGLKDEWVRLMNELSSLPEYPAFLSFYTGRLLAALSKSSCELYGSMNMNPEDIINFGAEREQLARERITKNLSKDFMDLLDTWQNDVFPAISDELAKKKLNDFETNIKNLHDKWASAEVSQKSSLEFFIELITDGLSSLKGNSKLKITIEGLLGYSLSNWKNLYRDRALLAASLLKPQPFSVEEVRVLRMLSLCAAVGWRGWETAKENAALMSFSDFVRNAGIVLKLTPSYSGKFKHIIIDEFQDTDSVQESLVSLMVSSWGGESGRTLFVVGDIKQSIYRFRHADPKLFADYITRASASPDADYIPLSFSYRMNGALMDGINSVFRSIWIDGVTGGEGEAKVEYESLEPPVDAEWWAERNLACTENPIEIIIYASEKKEMSLIKGSQKSDEKEQKSKILKGDKRMLLAYALSERLKEMVESEKLIWDKDREGNPALRPMRWGDIAVLVPKRTEYKVLEEVFEASGIPAVFDSARGFFNRGEVQDIINLLRLLDRPDDTYALSGWIECALSGIPHDTAQKLISEGLESELSLPKLFAERFPVESERLRKLRCIARYDLPSRVILNLLEDSSWLGAYKKDIRSKVLSNIRRCYEMIVEYEASMGLNLSACADYLGSRVRMSDEAEEPEYDSSSCDLVRVLTVHKSKGLEFPVVALVGMDSPVRKNNSGSKVFPSRYLGVLSLRVPDIFADNKFGAERSKLSDSISAKWHSYLDSIDEAEEAERLMYVAMTRAKDHLICCGITDGEKKLSSGNGCSWIDWLLKANDECGGRFRLTVVGPESLDPAEEEMTLVAEPRSELQISQTAETSAGAILKQDLRLSSFSASAYALLSWCPEAYRLRYRQGRELKWETPGSGAHGGSDMGSLAHWILRFWDFRAESIDEYLPGNIERRQLEKHLRRLPSQLRPIFSSWSARSVLRDMLSAFADTDECAKFRKLANNSLLRREISFRVPFEGSRLVGSMDLYWEDEKGIHIRDWKTAREDHAPDEFYYRQLRFYALACMILRPNVYVDAALVWLRPTDSSAGGALVSCLEDMPEIYEDVRASARIAVSGPFKKAEYRCEVCPFMRFCYRMDSVLKH